MHVARWMCNMQLELCNFPTLFRSQLTVTSFSTLGPSLVHFSTKSLNFRSGVYRRATLTSQFGEVSNSFSSNVVFVFLLF